MKAAASEFDTFIGQIFPRPSMRLFKLHDTDGARIRNPWSEYQRLILVGHSLGCVVIRECVENQFRKPGATQVPWLPKCELRLFAAAQGGFKVSGWKLFAFDLLPHFISSIPEIYRAFDDLQKNSTVLKDLRDRTEKLAVEHPGLQCLRGQLLYGRDEEVVQPIDFDCDNKIEWRDHQNHTSVCKPSRSFTDPFEFVTRDVLKKPAGA